MRRNLIIALLFLVLYACSGTQQNGDETKTVENKDSSNAKLEFALDSKETNLSSKEEQFLDKIEEMDRKKLVMKTAHRSDSIFYHPVKINKTLDAKEFLLIQKAIKEEKINLTDAEAIFGTINIKKDFIKKGNIPVRLFSFASSKNDFSNFALVFSEKGSAASKDVYFFNGNFLIEKHSINNHYGIEIAYFIESDHQPVVYYTYQYMSGSGIWWNNYYFYKYDGKSIIPALNLLANSNVQFPWSSKSIFYETKIIATSPLQTKMEYEVNFTDEKNSYSFVEGSTNPEFQWNEKKKAYDCNYEMEDIKTKMCAFYLYDSDLLFIKEYMNEFRNALTQKSGTKLIKSYLNDVQKKMK